MCCSNVFAVDGVNYTAIGSSSVQSQSRQSTILRAGGIERHYNTNKIGSYDHNHCLSAISIYEKKYSLPRGLLYSIALVESGLWSESQKKLLPHPWSLNVNGKGYYFKTQAEALEFFKSELAKGVENIDVGCGQVNWRVHGKQHFKKPEHALNPTYNIAYSAYFLSQNFAETKSWKEAIAMYHSRTKERGYEYYIKVKDAWRTVADSYGNTKQSYSNNPLLHVANRTHHKLVLQNKKSSITAEKQRSNTLANDIIIFARNDSSKSSRQ